MVKSMLHTSSNPAKEHPVFITAGRWGNLEVAFRQKIKAHSFKASGVPNECSPRCFDGVIEPEQFYQLALEMINANPQAAVMAFGAALQKVHAVHPPKPEPKPQAAAKAIQLDKKKPINATPTTEAATA